MVDRGEEVVNAKNFSKVDILDIGMIKGFNFGKIISNQRIQVRQSCQ
jgi:hypothetical protein